MKKSGLKSALASALFMLIGGAVGLTGTPASAQQAPTFTLDHSWPKPLPNNWQIGPLTGIYADRHGLIWTASQSNRLNAYDLAGENGISDCCTMAPQIIAFNKAGDVVKYWEIAPKPGKGVDTCGQFKCINNVHTVYVDDKDNVWVVGNGRGDNHILKFDYNGKFLLQIGGNPTPGCCGNQDGSSLGAGTQGGGTGVAYWPATDEVFVTDGYINRRIVVYDATTGAFKRMWGAYGKQPPASTLDQRTGNMVTPEPERRFEGPGAEQWSTVHGVAITPDGMVWVADRVGNRVQRFKIDGTFIDEHFISRQSRSPTGTVYSFSFSPDGNWVYIADGGNKKVHILNRRTMQPAGFIGGCGGQMDGCFNHLHVATTDREGNVYTGEAASGARFNRWNINK